MTEQEQYDDNKVTLRAHFSGELDKFLTPETTTKLLEDLFSLPDKAAYTLLNALSVYTMQLSILGSRPKEPPTEVPVG